MDSKKLAKEIKVYLNTHLSNRVTDLDLKYDIFLDTQIISEDELNNGLRGKHPLFQIAIKEGLHA